MPNNEEKWRQSFESFGPNEQQAILGVASDIVENLPPKAVDDLLSAYNNDIDLFLRELYRQTARAFNFGDPINSKGFEYLESVKESMDLTLKKLSYNYFKTTVIPNFRQGWRNLEWGNLVQLYQFIAILASRGSGKSYEFCFAFPLWRLYSYDRPSVTQTDTPDNHNRKETAIITNTAALGKLHVDKISEEIQLNDLLAAKLNKTGNATLAATSIETETGSKLHMRGKDGFIRGLHVGAAISDDLLDESSLYSSEQRDKILELFRGTISPIVEPYGYNIVSGTPFHDKDLYAYLKEDPRFKYFEYPAIFPNGALLAPDRITFDILEERRKSLGTLVFSREYLVVPLSDDASIFPYEYLMRSTYGMEQVDFVENIDYFPIKLVRVAVGCDFAISGQIGADYTVYSAVGVDSNDQYYLLNYYRVKGASHNEQVEILCSFDRRYRPSVIVNENNGFQSILGSLAKERGLKNLKPFTTTASNKKDLHSGLPSLGAMFERGQIKIPFKEGHTKQKAEVVLGEFNSIAFRSDKNTLESIDGHDDIVMSIFMAIQELRENKVTPQIHIL